MLYPQYVAFLLI